MQKVVAKQKELTNSDNLPEGAVIFTCPTVKVLQQLLTQVAEIKKQIAKQTPDKSTVIDNADLMKEYHISRTTAAEWRQSGLEYYKKGNKLFYKREAISLFLEKHKHQGF